MKKARGFSVGDKVFAKVKGYPAWPAVIIEDQTTKYNVKFYGTGETGIVKSKDLFYYLKHKNTFTKSLKRKDYNDAIDQIEEAIKACGTDGDIEDNEAAADSSISNTNLTDADKNNKRKRSMVSENDTQTKKKLAPVSSISNTNAAVIAQDSTFEDSENIGKAPQPEKCKTEISSSSTDAADRSGRKAKSKISTEASEKKEAVSSSNSKPAKVSSNERGAYEHDNNENRAGESAKPETKEAAACLSASDVKLITDDYLRALIAYADHVKKNEEIYKKKPMEPRQQVANEIVAAKLPSGKYIGIKYNRDEPPPFDSEFERAEYDESEAKTILSLKTIIENGSCKPESDSKLFEMNLDISETQIRQLVEFELIEHKKAKLKWLKIESSLIELDAKIKGCLGLDKAEPKAALEHLDTMLQLEIDPLMLKKHPHVVDMVKRLRRYIGNVKEWNLADDELEKFEADAENVREKADDVYAKFASLFNMPNYSLFWDLFSEEVEEFKEQVKDLHESQVFALSSEPNSRQAFLDRIDEEEEMKIIESKMGKAERAKPEKDSSSKVANSDDHTENPSSTS